MASLSDIKRRIGAVKNTRQITKAMKMVAGAKLRKATDAATSARPYQESLSKVLASVSETIGADSGQPLLTAHESVEKVVLVVFGTDRGLCGSFNTTIFRGTLKWIEEQKAAGREVELWTIGKKAPPFFKARGLKAAWATQEINPGDYMPTVRELAERLEAGFVSGEFQEVYLGYNHFVNVLNQPTGFNLFLPMSVEKGEDETEASGEVTLIDYKYEPDAESILETLLPLYLQTLLLQAFLETAAGEQASRMTAMENATNNASEIIDNLTLEYNRARQAAITKELIEIVSGAEAL